MSWERCETDANFRAKEPVSGEVAVQAGEGDQAGPFTVDGVLRGVGTMT